MAGYQKGACLAENRKIVACYCKKHKLWSIDGSAKGTLFFDRDRRHLEHAEALEECEDVSE